MIFKALGSPVRVKILRLIQEKEGLNIKQLAQNLQLPVTTLSPHLVLLEEAGLIEFRVSDSRHTETLLFRQRLGSASGKYDFVRSRPSDLQCRDRRGTFF